MDTSFHRLQRPATQLEPAPGVVAICGLDKVGIIMSDSMQTIEGDTAPAWTGIKINSQHSSDSAPSLWLSGNPRCVVPLADILGASAAESALRELKDDPTYISKISGKILADGRVTAAMLARNFHQSEGNF